MIMQLHGASCYFDCTSAVFATDGQLLTDAQKVADKLNIQIFRFCPSEVAHAASASLAAALMTEHVTSESSVDRKAEFDFIWQNHVIPLQGMVLRSEKGRENTILKVDWTGIVRITSNGKTNTLPIEIFRSVICHLLTHGSLTRQQINDDYAKRGSSGVFLVLEQIPLFERTNKPMGLTFHR